MGSGPEPYDHRRRPISPVPVEHPDAEQVAALDADALGAEEAGAVRTHLAGCAACRGVLDDVRRVRTLLTEAPTPPIPEDVAGRLAGALAGAAVATQGPTPEQRGRDRVMTTAGATVLAARRPRWSARLAALAAAAAFLGLLSGVGYLVAGGGGRTSGGATTGASAAGVEATPLTVVNHTGNRYTMAALRAAVPALLSGSAGGSTTLAGGDRAARPSIAGAAPAAPAGAGIPAPLATLADPQALRACADHVGEPGVAPLAVDYAYLDGLPRVILLFPIAGQPSRVMVIAAPPDCARNPDTLYQTVFADRG